MPFLPSRTELYVTAYTLLAGAVGAAAGWAVDLPVYLLTGPAICVSLLSLTGLRLSIAVLVRDISFLFIGIGIGAGVDEKAVDAMARWPLAFVALAVMLFAALYLGRMVLVRGFGFTPQAGVLSAAPGHFSFVLALGETLGVDMTKIAVVQSVRLLFLTLSVPFVAMALGVEISGTIIAQGQTIGLPHGLLVVVLSIIAGFGLKRLRVPAPLLIGAMIVSAAGHVSDVTPGVLPAPVSIASLLIVGTLIGSRFSGLRLPDLRRYTVAGLVVTAITVLLALLAAVPVAALLNVPPTHVVVAFAPGGLETMIAMGAVFGANPGFVAACHVGRLLVLTVLIPVFLGRAPLVQRPPSG